MHRGQTLGRAPREANVELAIVGAGPAGSSTALFLLAARPDLAGRIVLLERRRFPRDKFCAGAIGGRADRLLAQVGVKIEVPSLEIDSMSVTTRYGTASRRSPGLGRVVRRTDFDQALAREALVRGALLIEEARVDRLEIDADAVTVRWGAESIRARAVVGADGVGSTVRKALGLPFGGLCASVIEAETGAVAGDLDPTSALHFDVSDPTLSGYAWDFPTPSDRGTALTRGVYGLARDGRPLDVEPHFLRLLERRGIDPSQCRQKRMLERGFERHQSYARPRVLLVGEAAGVDPLTGEGIAQAIAYGATAAKYLADRLGRGALGFEDWRAVLHRSTLGFELSIVQWAARGFLGRGRPAMERLLTAMPWLMIATTNFFAGRFPGYRDLP